MRSERPEGQTIANGAGATLGELVSFSVGEPEQRGRFGPQPRVIRPPQPDAGQRGPVMEHERARQRRAAQERRRSVPGAQTFTCPDGTIVTDVNYCPSRSFSSVTALSGENFNGYAEDAAIDFDGFAGAEAAALFVQDASTAIVTLPDERRVERLIPSVTKTETVMGPNGEVTTTGARVRRDTTNALAMSLQSGPRDIRVSATLAFDYDTPLTGVIIRLPETQ